MLPSKEKVVKLQLSKPRTHVYKASVLPEWSYGFFPTGLAPTSLTKMKSKLAKHLGWQSGMCSHSLIDLELPYMNPLYYFPVRVLLHFISLWTRDVGYREHIDHAWKYAMYRMTKCDVKAI